MWVPTHSIVRFSCDCMYTACTIGARLKSGMQILTEAYAEVLLHSNIGTCMVLKQAAHANMLKERLSAPPRCTTSCTNLLMYLNDLHNSRLCKAFVR